MTATMPFTWRGKVIDRPIVWCDECNCLTARGSVGECLPCGRARSRKRMSDPAVREHDAALARQRYANDAGREQKLAEKRERYANDSEFRESEQARSREQTRNWLKDPAALALNRASTKAWSQTAAGKRSRAQGKHRRRARKVSAPIGLVPPDIKERLHDLLGGRCAACCCEFDMSDPLGSEYPSVEHIVALGPDGPDCQCNLTLLCRSCNSSKGATPLAEWVPPWRDEPFRLLPNPGCGHCGLEPAYGRCRVAS